MAAEQRKLLEKLMGADSLGFRSEKSKRGRGDASMDLHDPRICKSFVVGTCVHDIFANTKDDLGPCPKLHLEKYRIEYEALKDRGKEFPDFYAEYERQTERLASDVKRRIDTNNARLEKTPEDVAKLNEVTKQIEEINTHIAISMQEIEQLGRLGLVKDAYEKMVQLEAKRKEKEIKEKELKNITEVSGFSGYQKLQVCSVCGAYMSRLDTDRRLADHYIGKMHVAYLKLWQCYEDAKKLLRK